MTTGSGETLTAAEWITRVRGIVCRVRKAVGEDGHGEWLDESTNWGASPAMKHALIREELIELLVEIDNTLEEINGSSEERGPQHCA
jgi:hypothetical protein